MTLGMNPSEEAIIEDHHRFVDAFEMFSPPFPRPMTEWLTHAVTLPPDFRVLLYVVCYATLGSSDLGELANLTNVPGAYFGRATSQKKWFKYISDEQMWSICDQ